MIFFECAQSALEDRSAYLVQVDHNVDTLIVLSAGEGRRHPVRFGAVDDILNRVSTSDVGRGGEAVVTVIEEDLTVVVGRLLLAARGRGGDRRAR